MRRVLVREAIVLSALAGLVACREEPAMPAKPPAPPLSRPASAVVAPDPVLARVNGMPVRQSEIDAAMMSVPEQMRMPLMTDVGRKELLEEVIKMKVLEAEARSRGLEGDPKYSGQIAMATGNILANAALEKIAQELGEANLQQLYEKNKKDFEGVRLQQILVAYEGGAIPPARGGKPLSIAAARSKAEGLVRRIRAGEAFEKLARSSSDDGSTALEGGDLGVVTRGVLPPNLEQPVFALTKGEITGPLQSRYGFHIFKAVGSETKSFEDARPLLERRNRRGQIQEIINDLRKKAAVTYEPGAPGQNAAAGGKAPEKKLLP